MASTVMTDLTIGASVSVNGACLTAVARTGSRFPSTCHPKHFGHDAGRLTTGACQFERAMKLNERIGGHMVSGHVDGSARFGAGIRTAMH